MLNRCKLGDRNAQFEIYRLYYRQMYNSSLRIVGATDIAEDIMQESFLTAFQKLNSFKGEASFGVWLKRIVINNSLDYLRKRKVLIEELNENLDMTDDDDQEPDNLTAEEVMEAISALPDGYRTVLLLILIEGYDHEEASRMMGVRNVSTRTQFSRARKKLQEILIKKRAEKLKKELV